MRLQWPSKQVEDLASFPGLLAATDEAMEDQRTKSGTSYVFCPNRVPGRHQDKAQHSGIVPAIPGRLATMNVFQKLFPYDRRFLAILSLPEGWGGARTRVLPWPSGG